MRTANPNRIHLLLFVSLGSIGCISTTPTPLVSDSRNRFGVASATIHRGTQDVAKAARRALDDLSLTVVRQDDFIGWEFEYEAATHDKRKVFVKIDAETGPTEGDPIPLRMCISRISVRVVPIGDRELSRAVMKRIEDRLREQPDRPVEAPQADSAPDMKSSTKIPSHVPEPPSRKDD